MKVLVYCPAAPGYPGVEAETWASIMGLAWDSPLDILVAKGDIDGEPGDRVVWKYQEARKKFRQLGLAPSAAEPEAPVAEAPLAAAVDAEVPATTEPEQPANSPLSQVGGCATFSGP